MVEWLTTSLKSHETKVKAVHKSKEKMSQFSKRKNVVIGNLTLVWLWHRWGAWRGEAPARVQVCLQMFVNVSVNSTTSCPHAHLQSWLLQCINGDFILCNIKCISYYRTSIACGVCELSSYASGLVFLHVWYFVTVTRPIIVIWHGYLPRCTGRHYNKTHN